MPSSRALATLPLLAVVGRPNVGKSTLFNRFVGKRQAIVEDRARTTRDRMYGEMEWNGRRFVIVDTGGLEVDTDDPIEIRVQEQARLAIREADVILFLVDAVAGLTPADLEAAELLRTATKPIIVAVNKVDNTQREADAAEFWSMGWEETYSISASHGRGTGDLLDAIVWAFPPESEAEIARKTRDDEADEWAREIEAGTLEPYVVGAADNALDPTEEEEAADLERFEGGAAAGGTIEARWDAAIAAETSDDEPAAIAFVGRPNVGKSSLLNSLLGEDRAIVSDIPGTTRDAIDTTLAWGRSEIVLIDTAGIKRRGKVANGPAAEKYSTLRALKAIARCDVAVLVIDAVEGLTAQDAHVAGYVVEEGRGLVIAVNKWDLVEDKTDKTFLQYTEWIRNEVPFLEFAPIVSISAKTGQRVGKVLELAIDIWGERRKRVTTGELNRVLRAAVERQQPPVVKGRRPKVFYGTQAGVAPPTFVFFANDAALIHFSYRRYIENRLREEFGFDGTPVKLVFRDRESVKLPRRRSGAQKNAVSKGPGARRPASGAQRPGGGANTPGGARPAGGRPAGAGGSRPPAARPTGARPTGAARPDVSFGVPSATSNAGDGPDGSGGLGGLESAPTGRRKSGGHARSKPGGQRKKR